MKNKIIILILIFIAIFIEIVLITGAQSQELKIQKLKQEIMMLKKEKANDLLWYNAKLKTLKQNKNFKTK